ncbi:hypothetical protein [Candidatus Accumulibacter sp. ACC005]|uniref:hypothetical protein n=1 Tax=Candidatus Accumulibacter sp. ACC005 TaxID=2823331 RepID=UPI0025BD8478|nr:hypothetical protein [Candidatus Accumulibacter sp. ACC005]
MIRDDLSNKLIHFTRGPTREAAAQIFMKIVKEGKLRGGTGCIRDGWRCVCFTEAPIAKLSAILASPGAHGSRYEPYGVMVDKTWLFQQGGRPVIYQAHDEYDLLPEELKYRHVRYEPHERVDFSWEREWRIRANELILDPNEVTLVVPQRVIKDVLIDSRYSDIANQHAASGSMPEIALSPYPWHFIVLSDLGVPIESL